MWNWDYFRQSRLLSVHPFSVPFCIEIVQIKGEIEKMMTQTMYKIELQWLLSFFLHAQVKLPILRSIHTNQNAEMKLFFDLLHHSVWNSTSDVLRYRTECEQGFFRTHYTASNLDKQIRMDFSPFHREWMPPRHDQRTKCLT